MRGMRDRLVRVSIVGSPALGAAGGDGLMEALLLAIYRFFVSLVFIEFKWLPWNEVSQVTVVIIPIVALTPFILLLNVDARRRRTCGSSSTSSRSPRRCRGGVIDVQSSQQPVGKGEVLFRLGTALVRAASEYPGRPSLPRRRALSGNSTRNSGRRSAARARTAQGSNSPVTGSTRQHRELADSGAGDRFALEQARPTRQLEGTVAGDVAAEAQVRARLGATVGDDQAEVAGIKAQLANARSELSRPVSVRRPTAR